MVATVVVLVTAPRPPRFLATNKGIVIKLIDANSCKWQEDVIQKVVGSNPGAKKVTFCPEISVKVYLYDHLVSQFVYYTSVSCIMY